MAGEAWTKGSYGGENKMDGNTIDGDLRGQKEAKREEDLAHGKGIEKRWSRP